MSNNSSSSSSSSGGIGFAGLLTIVFITLKLIGTIDWSWWWVLSPIWISFGIALAALILLVVGGLVFAGIKTYLQHRRNIQVNQERIERIQTQRAKQVNAFVAASTSETTDSRRNKFSSNWP